MLTIENVPNKDEFNWSGSPVDGVILLCAGNDSDGNPIDETKRYWVGRYKESGMIALIYAGPAKPVHPLQAAMTKAAVMMMNNGYYGASDPVPANPYAHATVLTFDQLN